MQMRSFTVIAWLLSLTPAALGLVAERSLRATPVKATTSPATAATVAALRKKLEGVAHGLESMLSSESGSQFGKSQVAPIVGMFLKELQSTLADTKDAKNLTAAMQKLEGAQASVAGLGHDLETRQQELMHEDEAQRCSLLLGVLMTRKAEPMEKQLEVLSSIDFAGLPVSEALKAHHDASKPLFEQAASYLDAHHGNSTSHITGQSKAEAVAASLQKRVDALQREYDMKAAVHTKKTRKIEEAMKTAAEGAKKVMKSLLNKEERTFKKWAAMRQHDIQAMSKAVSAVKKGDMSALSAARASLMDSLKALKARSGGFLYLIQVGASLEERDCPYCAAQCVDTCHDSGKAYAQCLMECADAGKGF